jgi:hypothetical protein
MLYFITAFAVVCLTTIFLYYSFRHPSANEQIPLPPGPSVISLIIDEVFRDKPTDSGSKFTKWAHKYGEEYLISSGINEAHKCSRKTPLAGDIVHISVLNRHVMIINSAQMAMDMMDAKGSIYSNRELTTMIKLIGWGDIISFTQPGERLKQMRTHMHKLLGNRAAMSQHRHIIENESHSFLRRVLSSYDDLAGEIRL